ncbi:neurobeachin-like protein 1 [Acanthaster planci]|uniref:Neurobeachin-like protein 1 n=1 Tax=Acanthaster planci TaxID=133434 RepID=A0A8B7XG95_ACAPL|nr:neurobeachin-like protein 1 [Acanthaster planci]XP_022079257.1 neurobeachin-like protein 1 [Acanthaster planci]
MSSTEPSPDPDHAQDQGQDPGPESGNEQLYQLWMLYTSNSDVQFFQKYLERFIENYNREIDLEFRHLEEGQPLEGPGMSKLPGTILQVITKQLAGCAQHCTESGSALQDSVQLALQMLQALTIICRHHDNLALVASCEYLKYIVPMTTSIINKMSSVDDGDRSLLVSYISQVLHLFECMYDPYHIWRKQQRNLQVNLSLLKYKPSILSVELVPFFYDCLQENTWRLLQSIDVHVRVIHMFGAVLAGSQENAQVAISPATVDVLFALLDTPVPSSDFSVAPAGNLQLVQELALRCIVLMVLATHGCPPEQRQVELSEIIQQVLQKLSSDNVPQQLQLAIFRSIPQVLHGRRKLALQEAFVSVDVFGILISIIEKAILSGSRRQLTGFFCLHIMAVVMADCPLAKTSFRETIGYHRLGQLIISLGQPSQQLIGALLDMMVDTTFKAEVKHVLHNTGATHILMRLLPLIKSEELQISLSHSLASCCSQSDYNRMQCCNDGILSTVLDALEARESLHRKTQERLIVLTEALGSYSISSTQLKRLIGLMRGTDDQSLSPQCLRLMHALSVMARKEGKKGAHHYFDLQENLSGISIPVIRKWPGHGFTFHTWLCLNNTPVTTAAIERGGFYRRQLYSFFTGNGAGFEAFFTHDGVLVVAVCTKKEYYTVSLTDYPISDSQWHCVDVTHMSSRRPFSQSQLCIYVDGHQRLVSQLKFPIISEPFISCRIGYPIALSSLQQQLAEDSSSSSASGHSASFSFHPSRLHLPFKLLSGSRGSGASGGGGGEAESPVGMVPVGMQDMEWGEPRSLQGQLGSVCVFHDVLQAQQIKKLYALGANNMTLFQSDDSDISDLSSKLLLYYHGKACRDPVCLDLAPAHLYNGRLKGHSCDTWDVKDVLNCIGGVQVLFPLLELVTQENETGKPAFLTHANDDAVDSREPVNKQMSSDDEWEVIPHDQIDLRNEQNHVAGFVALLKNMCVGHPINQDMLHKSQGIATIGALLQKVDSLLIDVNVLMAIKHLVEAVCFGHQSLLKHAYRYILFDFRIWSKSVFEIRIGHLQYISTMIKDDKKRFRRNFGVQFLLDTIRTYYSPSTTDLSAEDSRIIRNSLLGLIRFYVSKQINHKELSAIINFVTAVEDEILIGEVIDMLITFLESSSKDQLYLLLFEEGKGDLLYALLTKKDYTDTLRVRVFKMFSLMLRSNKVYEKSKHRMRLMDVGFSGLTLLMGEMPVTMPIAKNMVEMITEGHINYAGLLAVLQLLHRASSLIKLEACTQLLHILYTEKESKVKLAKVPGWQDTLARLFVRDAAAGPDIGLDLNGLALTPSSIPTTPTTPQRVLPTDNADNGKLPGCVVMAATSFVLPDAGDSQATDASDLLADDSSVADSEDITSSQSVPRLVVETDTPDSLSYSESLSVVSSDANFGQFVDTMATGDGGQEQGADSDSSFTIGSWPGGDYDSQTSPLHASRSSLNSATPTATLRPSHLILPTAGGAPGGEEEEGPEGSGACERTQETLADTLTEVVVQLMWRGVPGSDEEAWAARGQIFVSLSKLAEKYELLRPANQIKRHLLEKLLEVSANDIKNAGSSDHLTHAENALWLMKLVQDFLFGEDQEDSHAWSDKLAEAVIDVIDALCVWEDTTAADEWAEMSQLGLRIMLGFAAHDDIEVCATAAARLHHLLQTRPIPSPSEACFLLGSLDSALMRSLDARERETYAYLIPLTRAMIELYHKQLGMPNFLPHLPTTDTSPTFFEDFQSYCRSEEWRSYIEKQVKPFMQEYLTLNFSSISAKMGKLWRKCFDLMNTDIHRRERERGESKLRFQAKISEPFSTLCKTETTRHASILNKLQNQHQSTLRQWRASKRFLTGERGAWAERTDEHIYWKLSAQENFSRMHLKLTQNFMFDQHIDASQMRDNTGPVAEATDTLSLEIVKEARVSDMELQDDRLGDEEWNIISESTETEQGGAVKEKTVVSEECNLITLVDVIPGKLEVTTTHVYFYDNSPDKEENAGQDFKWSLSHLREVHLRRYNLRRSAIEIFFISQTNYFINFKDKKTRNKAYSRILSLKPPNLYYTGAKSPADLLKSSTLTTKWVNREISNFDYLMQLNTIAGRTYNDLSQYPVFPWILCDYTCETLDLQDPKVYRDLTKPIGVVNPKNIEEVQSKFENFEDPTGTIDKFHYGTHYSNAAGVMHYLVRVEPFTSLHIQLQSGKFDCADRQFHSIPSLWDTLMENPNDVKELIPEFFYMPEFLENRNNFDLGYLQTGERVNDVILPNWASSPEDFINKHRQALESEHVSANLHHWIDLIFGYKQKGPAAIEALNVFYYCTYEGAVDLDAIKDPLEREAVEGMINNFGQTPCQLLKEPHPKRMSVEELSRKASKNQTQLLNVFDHLSELKAFFVEVSTSDSDPLVYVHVPRSQPKSFIYQGMPDAMVTVTEKGTLGSHGWLPYDKSISNYFTFDRDSSLINAKIRKTVSGPFAPGLKVTPSLFVTTHDAKLLLTGGHWDNSLRVFSVAKGKPLAHVVHHTDIITCLALDNCGMQLMTGSRDTTCMIWEIAYQGGVACGVGSQPVQTLCGHDDEVCCVAISTELDMAVSASKDSTVIIHTIMKGHYVRTLRPPALDPQAPLTIPLLALSDEGQVAAVCMPQYGKKASQELCSLHIYSINGKHLCDTTLSSKITHINITGEFLLTADEKGTVTIRRLFGLDICTTMPLFVPIHCVSVVPTKSQILVGLRDGKLIIVAVDRPAEARKLLGR